MIFVNLSKYEHLNSIQSLEELLLEFHITLLKIITEKLLKSK